MDPEKLEERAEKKEGNNIGKSLTRTNAERRLKKKNIKSFKSLQTFATNNTLEKNDLEDIEIKNIITIGQSSLKKKISKNLSQSAKSSYLAQASAKIAQKHDRNLFNDVDMMEKRRGLRKKKQLLNKKKLKNSRKT